uniref:type I polyketide synthase n=1 Tax=Nocardia carnea TaxID=37328 RepID=UPI00245640EE
RGRSYTRWGGFLYEAGEFDAGFFGIGPREALAMDPQQRILLEVAWEALEDAWIDPLSLRGSGTGVFAGVMYHDYGFVAATSEHRRDLEGYLSSGGMASVVSGRVAYALGLEGPAVTVDTACSSSLVAIHQACQALRAGDCRMALAGGVTVLATPSVFVEFSRQRGLSPDGRCKSFGAGADGVGWGEGAGVVVLERLSDARAAGRRVLGVVRGSAVNQDGASNGLTAPNGPSQVRVIRAALANAGVSAAEVDAVEAHGTGTTLGDPIEAQALLATYGQDRAEDRPLWLGSVKSNMGHTQAAAGVAGVIKMVEAMRHGVLPRTLHAEVPSPHVEWSSGAVALLTEPQQWPSTGVPRRAGVSSFGISGTNAHVILEEAPGAEPGKPAAALIAAGGAVRVGAEAVRAGDDVEPVGAEPNSRCVDLKLAPVPWIVSGRSPEAAVAQRERLRAWVTADPDAAAADIGRSLTATRAHLPWRTAVFAGRDGIEWNDTEPVRASRADTVLVFPGQGSQWTGMGKGLFEAFPVFRAAIEQICDPEWLFSGDTDLDRTDNTQLALFAVEVGLYRLLESWGVVADVVLGHSIGEIVAAHIAGCLSLDDAVRVVSARARLMAALPGGAMLTIEAAESTVAEELPAGLSVAAVNAPGSVVVSGPDPAIGDVERMWQKRTRVRRLRVSHAFHSEMVEPMLTEFETVCRGVTWSPPRIPIVSTVTGRLESDLLTDPAYWVRQVRDTVRFSDGIRAAAQGAAPRFLEVGPDAALAPMISRIAGDEAVVIPLQRRGRDQAASLVRNLTRAHCHGLPVDWEQFFAGTGARTVDLPTYAFQRRRYWLTSALQEGSAASDPAGLGLSRVTHPILHAVLDVPGGDTVFTGRLSVTDQPWLADHTIFGSVLLPGTGLIELAGAAGVFTGFSRVADLLLEEPLTVGDRGAVVRVVVGGGATQRPVTIYSRPDDGSADRSGDRSGWVRNASGTVNSETADTEQLGRIWPPPDAGAVDAALGYERLAELGYGYGPSFRGVRRVWRGGPGEVYADIEVPGLDVSAFGVHPALLDAALHAWAVSVAGAEEPEAAPELDGDTLWLPISFSGVSLSGGHASRLRVVLRRDGDRVSVQVADETGRPVASVDAVALMPVSRQQLAALSGRAALFDVEWVPVPESPGLSGTVWGLGDPNVLAGWGSALVSRWFADVGDIVDTVASGVRAPVAVVAPCGSLAGEDAGEDGAGVDVVDEARTAVLGALGVVQQWVAGAGLGSVRLILVTSGALSVRAAGDAGIGTGGLVQSGVVGLVRTAQLEYPGRLALVDSAGGDPGAALSAVIGGSETEVAVRDSGVWAPRLMPAGAAPDVDPVRPPVSQDSPESVERWGWRRGGVVLVVGGGELAGVIVRYLAVECGVRDVVVASRSGTGVSGSLVDELAQVGARVRREACDVGVREDVRRLVARVSAEVGALSGVVYTAGVLDDSILGALTPERVLRVLRAKLDGAWYVHEATRDLELDGFVLFSSVAGTVGSPGQANYAAANAFLDALAQYRRRSGLAACSLGWGLWEVSAGMAGGVADSDRARMGRGGLVGLSVPDGLALWDRALSGGWSRVVAARFDRVRLTGELSGAGGVVPSLMRGMVRASNVGAAPTAGVSAELVSRLAGLAADERRKVLVELVSSHVGAVLGFGRGEPVDARASFLDLGFDSLAAVELRNRLAGVTGVGLPATVAYDNPTPESVAEYIDGCLPTDTGDAAPDVVARVEALESALAGLGHDSAEHRMAVRRIRQLAARFDTALPSTVPTADDELFAFIDSDLGLADPDGDS